MIHKPRVELTPEQIRERTERASLRPYVAHIIDFDTHTHVNYLVFAEHPSIAVDLARDYGKHAPGSAGQAHPVDTAFIAHTIGQVGRLLCRDVDARCIVSTVVADYVSTLSDTTAQVVTASGDSEPITVPKT